MVAVIVGIGSSKFKTSMPVAASCSAAISAACHVPEDELEEKPSTKALQWGVVSQEAIPEGEATTAHCSLSSREVHVPDVDVLYMQDRRY